MDVMEFPDLERAYERLAYALDDVGPASEVLLLSKLVLALTHRVGDLALFDECLAVAKSDLQIAALRVDSSQ
jgi:hypothetical protein